MFILIIKDTLKKLKIEIEYEDINDAIDAQSLIDLAENCIITEIEER